MKDGITRSIQKTGISHKFYIRLKYTTRPIIKTKKLKTKKKETNRHIYTHYGEEEKKTEKEG